MKLTVAVVFIILGSLARSKAVDVECMYGTDSWIIVPELYACRVKNSLNITSKDKAVIDRVSPAPKKVVKGFKVWYNTIHYFPKNLDKLFPDLEAILILGFLKEVTQIDLKPFKKLRYIDLSGSDIEVLQDGLFDFNPDLEVILLFGNKISQIGLNVFDHLEKLSWLDLRENTCVNSQAKNRTEVEKLISEVKSKCPAPKGGAEKLVECTTFASVFSLILITTLILACLCGWVRNSKSILKHFPGSV